MIYIIIFKLGDKIRDNFIFMLIGVIFNLNKKGDKKVVKGSEEKITH